jgi:hypothetical protein
VATKLENKINERIGELQEELKKCEKTIWHDETGQYKMEDIREKILELKYVLGQASKPKKMKIPRQIS